MKEYLVHVRYCAKSGYMDDYFTNIKTDDVTKVYEIAYEELWKNKRVENVSFSRIIEEINPDTAHQR